MPALTKEELEARKRVRNSRIVEKSLDRMAILQETTVDRVNMPEEYYLRPNTDNKKQDTTGPATNPRDSTVPGGLDLSAIPDLSALQQALAGGNVGQLLSSLLESTFLGASGKAKQAKSAKNIKTTKLLLRCMNVVFLLLTAFSALVRICIAHYETSPTIRWISKYSVVPIFIFFSTVREASDLPHVKFKCDLPKLLILVVITYSSLVFKVLSMPIIQSLSTCTKAVFRTLIVHIAVYVVLWSMTYIGDRLLS